LTSNGWASVPLREVATQFVDRFDVQLGESYVNLGVKWYAEGVFAREPKLGSSIKAKNLYRVRPGQFIYNRMFATEGSFALVRDAHADGVVSNEFPVFDLDRTRLLPDFLALHFQQPAVWERVAQECVGTTKSRSRWKEDRFLAYELPLPPLAEQHRIVDLIGSLDDAIMDAISFETAIVRLRSALVSNAVHGQPLRLMSDLVEVSQGKSLPSRFQSIQTGNFPWFKIADMTTPSNLDGYQVAATYMTEEEILQRGGRVVSVGSVVFPRVGAAVLTEKKRIMDVPGALDENHIILSPKAGTHPEFLLGVMEGIRLSDLAQSGAVPSLNMGLIRRLEVPWAEEGKQEDVAAVLASLRSTLTRARNLAGDLRSLRRELLSALLSGAHRIPETYGELMGA